MTTPDVVKGTNAYAQNFTGSKPQPAPVPFYLGQTEVDGDTTMDDRYNGLAIYYDGADAITLTFPSSLFPGFTCTVVQGGAGQISFVDGDGNPLNNRQSFTQTAGQFAMMGVLYRADGVFYLGGDGAT